MELECISFFYFTRSHPNTWSSLDIWKKYSIHVENDNLNVVQVILNLIWSGCNYCLSPQYLDTKASFGLNTLRVVGRSIFIIIFFFTGIQSHSHWQAFLPIDKESNSAIWEDRCLTCSLGSCHVQMMQVILFSEAAWFSFQTIGKFIAVSVFCPRVKIICDIWWKACEGNAPWRRFSQVSRSFNVCPCSELLKGISPTSTIIRHMKFPQ